VQQLYCFTQSNVRWFYLSVLSLNGLLKQVALLSNATEVKDQNHMNVLHEFFQPEWSNSKLQIPTTKNVTLLTFYKASNGFCCSKIIYHFVNSILHNRMITDKLFISFCGKDLIHYGSTHRPSDCYANPEMMVLQSKF
jgi:hypothetical protein